MYRARHTKSGSKLFTWFVDNPPPGALRPFPTNQAGGRNPPNFWSGAQEGREEPKTGGPFKSPARHVCGRYPRAP